VGKEKSQKDGQTKPFSSFFLFEQPDTHINKNTGTKKMCKLMKE